MQDLIGPFLIELRRIKHFFKWRVDPKTGRLFGVHPNHLRSFTVMEAVAWDEHKPFVRYEDEYEAAKAIGFEGIVEVVKSACDHVATTPLRSAVVEMIMEREFCYGDHVRIKSTNGTVNQGFAGRRGSVVCAFGDERTDGVVVFLGKESVAFPVSAVEFV